MATNHSKRMVGPLARRLGPHPAPGFHRGRDATTASPGATPESTWTVPSLRMPSFTGWRAVRPPRTTSTQGSVARSRTALAGSTSASGSRPVSTFTETVMSGRRNGGGSGTSSFSSTVPRWRSTDGAM